MNNDLFKDLNLISYGIRRNFDIFQAAKDNFSFVQRLELDSNLKVHNGCVNTVCWNERGSLILSGSDDQHLVISDPYNRQVLSDIHTGHRANIFCARFLPCSGDNQVVSCSGDGNICYTDIERQDGSSNVFDCHMATTYKVVVVPGEAHSFMSCGEDGTVRWYDLRIKTHCQKENCQEDVLINCGRATCSLTVNPMYPWQLAAGCADSTIRIYDRRMLSTTMSGGGRSMCLHSMLNCFRPGELEKKQRRITSLSYCDSGRQLLASYSSDRLYLFDFSDKEEEKELTLNPTPSDSGSQIDGSTDAEIRPFNIHRLRLRGDWSDTGPNARPERERQDNSQVNPATNIMQRMSTMLTRWLENHARQLQQPSPAESQQPHEYPQGSSTHQAASSTDSSVPSANLPQASSELPGSPLEIPGPSLEPSETSSQPPGTSSEPPGPSSNTPGSPLELPGKSSELPGSSLDLVGMSSSDSGTCDTLTVEEMKHPSNTGESGSVSEGTEVEELCDMSKRLAISSDQSLDTPLQSGASQPCTSGQHTHGQPSKSESQSRRQPSTSESQPLGQLHGQITASSTSHENVNYSAKPSQSNKCSNNSYVYELSQGQTTGLRHSPLQGATDLSTQVIPGQDRNVVTVRPPIQQQSVTERVTPPTQQEGVTEIVTPLIQQEGVTEGMTPQTQQEVVQVISDTSQNDSSGASPLSLGSDSDEERPSASTSHSNQSTAPSALTRSSAARRLQTMFRRHRDDKLQREEQEIFMNLKLPKPGCRQTYCGHRNARTMIKEANFLGRDFVMCGSDCGHLFIWNKYNGQLVNLLEADRHVVNCVQPHPFEPIIATSGIDYDVKIWAPTSESSTYKEDIAKIVMERNQVMLDETRDTVTVPASFMLRLIGSIHRVERARRPDSEGSD